MTRYDVFNGDADGICALHQLRLTEPVESILVTGVKRDIQLLCHVPPSPDARVTVLDISLDSNREALGALLDCGAKVTWFDHHFAGEIPAQLDAHIDTDTAICTALLVDQHLGGIRRAWAVTAAFGDNLANSARAAAIPLGLSSADLHDLQHLGELLNYNAYGTSLADLHFPPSVLYRAIAPYAEPLAFLRQAPEAATLAEGLAIDLSRAAAREPILDVPAGRVYRYPDAPWARRVMGVVANRLARAAPELATALIVDQPDGSLRISVRAPKARPTGADMLARCFPGGGGRQAAAGINGLPEDKLPEFLNAFEAAF